MQINMYCTVLICILLANDDQNISNLANNDQNISKLAHDDQNISNLANDDQNISNLANDDQNISNLGNDFFFFYNIYCPLISIYIHILWYMYGYLGDIDSYVKTWSMMIKTFQMSALTRCTVLWSKYSNCSD